MKDLFLLKYKFAFELLHINLTECGISEAYTSSVVQDICGIISIKIWRSSSNEGVAFYVLYLYSCCQKDMYMYTWAQLFKSNDVIS